MGPSDPSFAVEAITNFPDTSVGPFVVTLDRGLSSEEKILCDSYLGLTITVLERGYDGTVAQSHGFGATVVCTLDANTIDQANDVVNGVGTVLPDTSAVGDEPAEGISPYPAAADHRHGREPWASGLVSTSHPGDAEADGVSTSPARADHKHAREASQLGLPVGGIGNATQPTRFVGATTSGPPTGGPFNEGDFVIDRTNFTIWICSVAGSPGTWVTPLAIGRPMGKLYQLGAQTLGGGGWNLINLGGEAFLSGGMTTNGPGGPGSNGFFVLPITGYYQVNGCIQFDTPDAGSVPTNLNVGIYLAGTQVSQGNQVNGVTTAGVACSVSDIIHGTAGNSLSLNGFVSGANTPLHGTGSNVNTFLSIAFLSQ